MRFLIFLRCFHCLLNPKMNTISVDVYSIIFFWTQTNNAEIWSTKEMFKQNKKKVLNNSKDNTGIPIDSTTNEMNLKTRSFPMFYKLTHTNEKHWKNIEKHWKQWWWLSMIISPCVFINLIKTNSSSILLLCCLLKNILNMNFLCVVFWRFKAKIKKYNNLFVKRFIIRIQFLYVPLLKSNYKLCVLFLLFISNRRRLIPDDSSV